MSSMASVKSLCVFCGASARVDAAYRDAASRFGELIARAGVELVFGGGRIGLMGLVAGAALDAGGRVFGVIPRHLHDFELGDRPPLGALTVVETMHERKAKMFDRADAFAILPGGLGTLDETFEIVTWKQLGLHDKPIVIVDVAGYWAPLRALLEQVVVTGFAPQGARDLYRVVSSVDDVLPLLNRLPEPSVIPKSLLS
jgi:uncharacterized protein (TIGR00730 family)